MDEKTETTTELVKTERQKYVDSGLFQKIEEFKDRVMMAKMNDEEWVETTQDVIAYFNRKGLGGADYFIYDGIKVTEIGKAQDVEGHLSRDLYSEAHGASVGKREGTA